MIDRHAQACRRLWASVMLTTLADFNKRHVRADPDKRPGILDEARLYLMSKDGREVAALSGMIIPIDRALKLIASPRDEFRARTHAKGERWSEEAE